MRVAAYVLLTVVLCAPAAGAQSFEQRLRQPAPPLMLGIPPQVASVGVQPRVSAQMHPVAKGALIGAAAGVGGIAAFGWWFCTQGPGECSAENWKRGIPLYAGIGAAVGALIGAIR